MATRYFLFTRDCEGEWFEREVSGFEEVEMEAQGYAEAHGFAKTTNSLYIVEDGEPLRILTMEAYEEGFPAPLRGKIVRAYWNDEKNGFVRDVFIVELPDYSVPVPDGYRTTWGGIGRLRLEPVRYSGFQQSVAYASGVMPSGRGDAT